MELSKDFKVLIKKIATTFGKLGMSVTPKFHAVFVHVSQFLERHKTLNKGLGYWSEQSSESVHQDFKNLWIDSC